MVNISVIGGDNRNVVLSNLLEKDGFNVFRNSIGVNDCSLEECIEKSDYIITSTPFSVDSRNVYCPLSSDIIGIEDFFELLKNKTVIGGKFSKEHSDELIKSGNTVIDLMKNESLALKNAIPTAEGIVKIIIENTDITIDGSNIAVLGFGRIGKRISKILNFIGANLFCMDTSEEEVANIKLCGYNVLEDICINHENLDVIVNTVPQMVIGEREFNFINKDSLIIDVASKPGGVDFKYAKENGYNVIHALGIPGKIAPVTSAKYIEEIIKNLII